MVKISCYKINENKHTIILKCKKKHVPIIINKF